MSKIDDIIIKNKIYTGVGSRQTPLRQRQFLTSISKRLSATGFHLRSGHADGADKAFERGTNNKTVFTPWKTFNGFTGKFIPLTDEVYNLASIYYNEYRPKVKWIDMKDSVKKLMARNIYQVIGSDINNPNPSDFLICYADVDSENNRVMGGTGFTVFVAQKFEVPIFNISQIDDLKDIKYLMTYVKYDTFFKFVQEMYLFHSDLIKTDKDNEIIEGLCSLKYIDREWGNGYKISEIKNYLDEPTRTLLEYIYKKYYKTIKQMKNTHATRG